MISCSVCGAENDHLAVVCRSCKSFLQAKVDNLNLFETLWGLMESPSATFRRIALARHKNYVVFLSCLLGIAVVYAVFWYMNLGVKFSNLAMVVGGGLLVGPIIGQLLTLVFSLLMHWIGRLLGGSGSFRNMHAVTAYSSSPIAYSLVFVFPIEIALFGIYFFANNPPPLVINPVAYVVLLGLDGAAVLWSWLLLIEGTIVANGFGRAKATALSVIMLAVTALGAYVLRTL